MGCLSVRVCVCVWLLWLSQERKECVAVFAPLTVRGDVRSDLASSTYPLVTHYCDWLHHKVTVTFCELSKPKEKVCHPSSAV